MISFLGARRQPSISTIKSSNRQNNHKNAGASTEIYISSQECTAVGQLIRKIDERSFIFRINAFSQETTGRFTDYITYVADEYQETLAILSPGFWLTIHGRMSDNNANAVFYAQRIEIHIPKITT